MTDASRLCIVTGHSRGLGGALAAQLLQPGTLIQIGPFKLTYTGKSLDQFDQAGALRIDARELDLGHVQLLGSSRCHYRVTGLDVAAGAAGRGDSARRRREREYECAA